MKGTTSYSRPVVKSEYDRLLDVLLRRHRRSIVLGQRLASILSMPTLALLRARCLQERPVSPSLKSIAEHRLGEKLPRDARLMTWAAIVGYEQKRDMLHRLRESAYCSEPEKPLQRISDIRNCEAALAHDPDIEPYLGMSSSPNANQSAIDNQ